MVTSLDRKRWFRVIRLGCTKRGQGCVYVVDVIAKSSVFFAGGSRGQNESVAINAIRGILALSP